MAELDSEINKSAFSSAAIIPSLDDTDSIPALLNQLLLTTTDRDLHDLEKHVLELGTTLSLITQETSTSLERTISEISRTVPRLGWDLQYLRDGADEVRNVLGNVQGKVMDSQGQAEEKEDEKVLKRLEYLDTIKTRMESARDVLKEAESWSTLESQVHSYLSGTSDNSDVTAAYIGIQKAARRLQDARTSLQVFRKTPADWNARNRLLTSLEDEAERRLTTLLEDTMDREGEFKEGAQQTTDENNLASLGLRLDDAARNLLPRTPLAYSRSSSHVVDLPRIPTISAIHRLFHRISRPSTFISVYFRHRRRALEELWSDANLLEESNWRDGQDSGTITTSAFLKRFFGEFLTRTRAERRILPILAAEVTPTSPEESRKQSDRPDPVDLLVSFLHTTLASLSPSVPQRLDRVVTYSGDKALLQLISCWTVTTDFAREMESLLAELCRTEREKSAPLENKGDTGTRSRRASISSTSGRPPSIHLVSSPSSILDQSPLANPYPQTGGSRSRSGSVSSAVDPSSATLTKRHSRRYSRAGPSGLLGVDTLSVGSQVSSSGMYPQRQHTDEQDLGLPSDWDIPLYDPFMPFLSDYAALEYRLLVDAYESDAASRFSSDGNAYTASRLATLLRDRAQTVYRLAIEAKGRAETFTGSWALFETITDVIKIVARVAQDSERDVSTLFERDNITGSNETSNRGNQKDNIDPSLRDELDDLAGFEGDSGSKEGDIWAGFAGGLEVLAGVRELKRTLDKIKREMSSWINDLNRHDGLATTWGLTRGGRKILLQSTLNSMARTTLLESKDLSPHVRPASDAIDRITSTTQRQLIALLLATPYEILRTYPTLPVWSQQDKQQRRAPGMPNLQVPTFSRSPTDEITRVTETVLGVLRVLEVCVSEEDGIMGWELGKLEGVQEEMLREALQMRDEEGSGSLEDMTGGSLNAKALFPTTHHSLSLPQTPVEKPIPAELVQHAWITSLTLTLLGHVTRDVLPSFTPPLTTTGSAQLSADLGYLSNAMRALDVETADMERWRRAVDCTNVSELTAAMQDMGDEGLPIVKIVQRLKGWA
ncbi:hypothetical protein QFC22_001467 [Naganishia vaughanmartiniae]|uniref:Uncharacterized protein n=1 Tax=Naganishia vaughanmartiniae TaxID=1424756 RepID=A0ACC2XIR3_9TREE|nr:hypothetical protein QFC22_001467 [Naganishia vaughanmartiniae]